MRLRIDEEEFNMALINQTIPNLINGVSQQAPTIRLPNQCEEMINGVARVSGGLSKRAAIKMLRDTDGFIINPNQWTRSSVVTNWSRQNIVMDMVQIPIQSTSVDRKFNTYMIATDIDKGRVHLMNTHTGLRSVLAPNTYFTAKDPNSIKFLTKDRSVYILNKEKVVEVYGDGIQDIVETRYMAQQGSIAYIRSSTLATKYTLKIELVERATGIIEWTKTVSASTKKSSETDADLSLSVETISNNLVNAMTTGGIDTRLVVTKTEGNVIHAGFDQQVYGMTYDIKMSLISDTSFTQTFAFNGSTRDPSTLPNRAPEVFGTYYTVKVDPDPTSGDEHYYLRYDPDVQGWLESSTRAPAPEFLYPDTLPRLLEFEDQSNGTHTFSMNPIVFSEREVGDHVTNPSPSFVWNTINDMFIFNNRLGFLSGNNIILSRIDDLHMFYRTSCAQALASDRVDITASIPNSRQAYLNYALPFETHMMLFGPNSQYLLATTTGFDLTKTALQSSTEYESSTLCRPANIGSSIYYAVSRNGTSAIMDLSRKDGVGLTAEEVTNHLPTYIKGNVLDMIYSTTSDMLFVVTDSEKDTIYVQNRFVRQVILEQNAWHKWKFDDDVVGISLLGSTLYVLLVDKTDNTRPYLTTMDLSTLTIRPEEGNNIPFEPYLDRLALLSKDSVLIEDDIASPYYIFPNKGEDLIGVSVDGTIYKGIDAINMGLLEGDVWVGYSYEFLFEFSEQVPAIYEEGSKTALQYSRYILRSLKLSYSNTSKFTVEVHPKGRQPFSTEFSGFILGDSESGILGKVNLATGVFKFPINNRSDQVKIKIKSDYPFPCNFHTCEFQGTLINKTGRF